MFRSTMKGSKWKTTNLFANKYIYIFALTTLNMAVLVPETCRWSLRNKITFIKPLGH